VNNNRTTMKDFEVTSCTLGTRPTLPTLYRTLHEHLHRVPSIYVLALAKL
jgi:hypothetical protein